MRLQVHTIVIKRVSTRFGAVSGRETSAGGRLGHCAFADAVNLRERLFEQPGGPRSRRGRRGGRRLGLHSDRRMRASAVAAAASAAGRRRAARGGARRDGEHAGGPRPRRRLGRHAQCGSGGGCDRRSARLPRRHAQVLLRLGEHLCSPLQLTGR